MVLKKISYTFLLAKYFSKIWCKHFYHLLVIFSLAVFFLLPVYLYPPVIFNLLLIWLCKDEVSFTRMLTHHDWFIGYCLLSSEQYFSYIVHGNKYNTIYKNYIEIRDGWANRTNNIWCHWKNWRGSRSGFEYPYFSYVVAVSFIDGWNLIECTQTKKQKNTHKHKQQQKHWNKMISNNYLTVGVD